MTRSATTTTTVTGLATNSPGRAATDDPAAHEQQETYLWAAQRPAGSEKSSLSPRGKHQTVASRGEATLLEGATSNMSASSRAD